VPPLELDEDELLRDDDEDEGELLLLELREGDEYEGVELDELREGVL
jgi:hypothetical protein